MGRKPKLTVISNGIDPEKARDFLSRIMRVYDSLDMAKIEHMQHCKSIRAPLKGIYEEATGVGIPAKILRARVKHEIEEKRIAQSRGRQAKAVPEDADDLQLYEQLVAALGAYGDTPLGAAALAQAQQQEDETDPRPEFLRRSDRERIAEQNAEKIRHGIRGMPGADDGDGQTAF